MGSVDLLLLRLVSRLRWVKVEGGRRWSDWSHCCCRRHPWRVGFLLPQHRRRRLSVVRILRPSLRLRRQTARLGFGL